MSFRFWQASAIAVLGLGLILAPAAAKAPAKSPPKAAAKSTTATGNANVVATLHQAKTLLDTAIHDYDGHRAKAVQEIHHAIKELAPHTLHKKGAAPAVKNANPGATPGETQEQSDKQLKQALQLLSSLNGQVSHAKASTHLQNAVGELNVALKIK
jgi:hypothetical protein